MKRLNILAVLFLLGTMVACKKEDLGDPEGIEGLGGEPLTNTTIDKWIMTNLTNPYNISVKYKWDQFELSLNKTLTPPKEEKIIPVMEAVEKVWIDPYVAEAGANFMKQYCPKYFVLAGSASWNTDGTVTLGTAEGGRKIVLYVLNDFRTKGMAGYQASDSFNIKQMFHTIQHEFGHILHQNVLYPQDFKLITKGEYTATWNNISDVEANRRGFVTAYAMSAFDEDFVEMVATMLVEGRDGFTRLLNRIAVNGANGTTPTEARAKLREKEAIVVNYFQTVWNIDFYSLQTRVKAEVDALIK